MDNMEKINHFGVLYKADNENLKIKRENYAIIDKKNHDLSHYRGHFYRMQHLATDETQSEAARNFGKHRCEYLLSIFEDESLEFYTDEFCREHHDDCLINFDLNMKFFKQLNSEEFEKVIIKLRNKWSKLKEIDDITKYDGIHGIYILVLDEYKQMYVGETRNICKRIKQHWNGKKTFDKLIFGRVEESVLSIDSFGPLDTTRIFIYETYDNYNIEERLVSYIPRKFLLNRTMGGFRGDFDDEIKLATIATRNKRNLK